FKDKKERGQNKGRDFGSSRDALPLCSSRATYNEFSARECKFGDRCKFEHDLRKYLKEGKREDLATFGGMCPIWEIKGTCPAGWKCRLAMSHAEEIEREDGEKELVLKEDEERKAKAAEQAQGEEGEVGVVNVIPIEHKIALSRKKFETPKSEAYLQWANSLMDDKRDEQDELEEGGKDEAAHDNRAQYKEPPFRPSEKRRIYYGPETPVLAPLTTQGNLPFRRLAVSLGAQVTWSEMAMGLPLIQGEKGEWALMKAHESELQSPKCNNIVEGYDNSKDIRFGAQIAANKPWIALKTTEVLTALCPHLRAIDLNCGCPIDLVCRQGGGSSLLDQHSKLEKMLRGMNYVSNEIPITVKIRMGTKDNHPTAHKLVKRLVLGGYESHENGQGASGVAAITLHGRSKQQRYTKRADWGYISDIAALIKGIKRERKESEDTLKEVDERDLPNGGNVYFCGNGDVYSHVEYQQHIEQDKVDSIMIGRGALVKPWIFEEIEKGQYLDKSATERLGYIEQFAKFGLEAWGSDEMGVGTTRRFLLEWLSFSC
ncbi:tRNA-dihydrouridine synthase 3, partial [Coniosporium uncinatum]